MTTDSPREQSKRSGRASRETEPGSLHLRIEPIVERAEQIAERIVRELPDHPGLARAAQGVAQVAHEAHRVSRRLQRVWGIHRIPAAFLLIALITILITIYFQFFHVSRLTVAISSRDAVELKQHLVKRVRFSIVETEGSTDSVQLLRNGQADIAFVQGGVDLPESTSEQHWLRKRIPATELVLFCIRTGREIVDIRRVLTSSRNQGSHSLARRFFSHWGISDQIEYVHEWRSMTDDDEYQIAEDVDAIFVVKDPQNSRIEAMPRRLVAAGFRFASPDVGAHVQQMPFLEEFTLRRGFLDPARHIPDEPVDSYRVATYLLASDRLTPRQLAAAEGLVADDDDSLHRRGFEPSFSDASDLMQGIEAGLGILVYIGLAFLALLGIDVFAYRRRFNDLNSLVSLISMHQSSKDALGGSLEQRAHNVIYLSFCSDLLGLISVITGYYTQENSSLMYNRLLDVIHERSNSLKINIQLKILHAELELPLNNEADAT